MSRAEKHDLQPDGRTVGLVIPMQLFEGERLRSLDSGYAAGKEPAAQVRPRRRLRPGTAGGSSQRRVGNEWVKS